MGESGFLNNQGANWSDHMQDEIHKEFVAAYKGKVCSRDGIINADRYHYARLKMLFVLAQPYTNEDGSDVGDLLKYWRDGAEGKKGSPSESGIARIMNGLDLLRQGESFDWNDLSRADTDGRKRWLQEAAIINLDKEFRKTDQDSHTNEMQLEENLAASVDIIRKQIISFIRPDVIVCLGVGEQFRRFVFPGPELSGFQLGQVSHLSYDFKSSLVFNMRSIAGPQQRSVYTDTLNAFSNFLTR